MSVTRGAGTDRAGRGGLRAGALLCSVRGPFHASDKNAPTTPQCRCDSGSDSSNTSGSGGGGTARVRVAPHLCS